MNPLSLTLRLTTGYRNFLGTTPRVCKANPYHDEHGRFTDAENAIPAAPGTTPLKPGNIRLYHQTSAENLEAIRREGLLLSKAKGIEGPKAIWATPDPFYGPADQYNTVEFQVPEADYEGHRLRGGHLEKVAPSEIIAIHEPWHSHARYAENNPEVKAAILAGEHDELAAKDSEYGPAIRYIKRKYGKVAKANPYHDALGRFTHGGSGTTWSAAGKFNESLGLDRSEMPQIRAPDHEEFLQFAKGKGVSVERGKATISDLKPAQKHFNPTQAAQMPDSALAYPLMVSEDNYVLDGTNRYVAILMKDPHRQIDVVRIGLKAHRALALMRSFPKAGTKSVSQVGSTAQVSQKANPYHDELGRFTFSDQASAAAVKTKAEIDDALAHKDWATVSPFARRALERQVKIEAIGHNFSDANLTLMEKLGKDWSASSTSVGAMRERAAVIGLTATSETEIEQRLATENVPSWRKDPKYTDETRKIAYETAAGGPLSKYKGTIEAIAATTQAFYPEEVTLYRGIGWNQTELMRKAITSGAKLAVDEEGKDYVPVDMGALSSWSEDKDTARLFAKGSLEQRDPRDQEKAAILKVTVPRSALFASWRSVGGHFGEKEVVIATKGTLHVKVDDITLVDRHGLGEPVRKIKKANPYHDDLGRFTFADKASTAAEKTKAEVEQALTKWNAPKKDMGEAFEQVKAALESGGSREAVRQIKLEALAKNFPNADISTLYEWGRAWSNASTSKGAMDERAVVLGLVSNSREELDKSIASEMKGYALARNIGPPAEKDLEEAQTRFTEKAIDTFERKSTKDDRGIDIGSLEAMAAVTQAYYPENVTLYRGVGYDQYKSLMYQRADQKGKLTLGMGTLSSWSEDLETARQFAKGRDGCVVRLTVPRSALLASWRSVGANETEKEVVIVTKGKITISADDFDRMGALNDPFTGMGTIKVHTKKFNPNHDELGKFTFANDAVSAGKKAKDQVAKDMDAAKEVLAHAASEQEVRNIERGIKFRALVDNFPNVNSDYLQLWGRGWSKSSTSTDAMEERAVAIAATSSSKEEVERRIAQDTVAYAAVDDSSTYVSPGTKGGFYETAMEVFRGEVHWNGARETLAAMAAATQAYYPETVEVYRGIGWEQYKEIKKAIDKGADKISVGLGALSSWSESKETARAFSIMHDGCVIKATVPRSALLASWRSVGASHVEQEVVVVSKGSITIKAEDIERRYPHTFTFDWEPVKQPAKISKFNPYHDEKGRFTSGSGVIAGTKPTTTLSSSTWDSFRQYGPMERAYLKELRVKQDKYESEGGQRGIRVDVSIHSNPPSDAELQRNIDMLGQVSMVGKLLKEQGQEFKVPAEPPPIAIGTPKQCFANATHMVIEDPKRYTYAEGIVLSGHLPIPIDHAWVVDNQTNTVIDPTLGWSKDHRYFGVKIDYSTLIPLLVKNEVYGVLHNSPGFVAKRLKNPPIRKANPYHDEKGRFTESDHAVSSSGKDEPYRDVKHSGEYAGKVNDELLVATREQWNSLHVQGLTDWVTSYSESSGINYVIGMKEKGEIEEIPAGDKATIDRLDDAIGQCHIPENLVVYRALNVRTFGFDPNEQRKSRYTEDKGITYTDVKNQPDLLRNAIGKDVIDPTYASSSLDMFVAEGFNNYRRVLMRLKVPKGSTGLYLGTRSELKHEYEVLLPRHSRYHVTGVEEYMDPLGYRGYYLDAELLPRHGAKVSKFNPYHDKEGKFTSGGQATFDPKQIAAEVIARQQGKLLVKETGERLKEVEASIWPKLTQHMRDSITDYTAFPDNFNEAAVDVTFGGGLSRRMVALDQAIEEVKAPMDFKVYRAVNIQTFGLEDDSSQSERAKQFPLMVGREFVDPVYVSTSLAGVVAKDFLNPRRALIEIEVPKGASALPLLTHSLAPSEQEVLLPRQSRYHVLEVKMTHVVDSYGEREVPYLKVKLLPRKG